MPLAPASSRGFFLNARFAVNGIQCAARSFGTLTVAGLGLLSNMEASSRVLGRGGLPGKLTASSRHGNANWPYYFRPIGRFRDGHRSEAPIQKPSPPES